MNTNDKKHEMDDDAIIHDNDHLRVEPKKVVSACCNAIVATSSDEPPVTICVGCGNPCMTIEGRYFQATPLTSLPVKTHLEEADAHQGTVNDEIKFRHASLNSFRPFFKGFPFSGNTIYQALMTEDIQDDAVISVGMEQIDTILRPSPFEPEHYGFKMDKKDKMMQTYISARSNGTMIILKKKSDKNTGYWSLMSRSTDGNKVFFPEFQVFIPNDLAARILLTSLGMIPRADLGEDGQGGVNDEDKDGICPQCENVGYCVMDAKKVVADKTE